MQVRRDVIAATEKMREGPQVPWDNSSLVAPFYFQPPQQTSTRTAPSLDLNVSIKFKIFISYSKATPEPTQRLAKLLNNNGYEVWWDTNLTAGEVFRDVIDRELDRRRCRRRMDG
jgi:hypothetical protein